MWGAVGQKMPFEHKKLTPPKNFKQLFPYLKQLFGGFFLRFGYIVKLVWDTGHWILFLLTFMALFKGVTPVVGALISQGVLNELQTVIAQDSLPQAAFWHSKVFYLLVFMFVYRIVLQITGNLNRALNRIAGEKVVRQVRLQIMDKSKQLDLASFDNPVFYEKMENANREAGNRPLNILSETFNIVSTIIEFASYLVILFTAPGLAAATLVIMAVSVPSAIINFIYRKKNYSYMRHRSKERREMNYYSGILVDKDLVKEVRIFDLADLFISRYTDVFARYYKGLRSLIFGETAWHAVIGIVSGVTNLVFYTVIAMQVFSGDIMIGDYSLYTGAIASVSACISTLISQSGSIYEGTLFIDNLIAFMEEEQTVVPKAEKPLQVEQDKGHTIRFEDVSFRYPGTEKDVLHKINLTINEGETMALVGLNGAGKTTFIKLLLRLYDPTEGRILLDGRDIKEYDLNSLYSTFGIIFQDFGRYAVTAEENIRFGNIHAEKDMARVEYAAQQSCADEYISRLPKGYDTPLMRIFEQDGMELSGGQWQKLAIARAFYADSDILILDEPTASLDPIAEQEIFRQMDTLRKGKTSIFVSHRLSSATMADQIIVLENGRLIENGSHQQLMAQNGRYAQLFATQAERYVTADAA
ncbi:MAG: ABC transporter ATP-binding protein [Ruminococcaceae bacterium]|nr:ABC transporter ATP-binding protein [Oscillospiraceae bacterium]